MEGVGFATAVDSLLAIKKYVYEDRRYTIVQVKAALQSNFQGSKELAIMQALFKNRAPKYGIDNGEADAIARIMMQSWAAETWKYTTPTGYRFRPGMLSWNYWAGDDAALTPATPDGRTASSFLSNAICPSNGVDIAGPTAVANSVGTAIGGKTAEGIHVNFLPNGASHTITFNPAILHDPEHKDKFKAYLRGYMENGGTALQVNMLDAAMLKDAQLHPQNYGNLLVRVTGYNAYFTAIGKELQDEIIARESHEL
jgi:pyruvate-formate lyase